MALTKRQLEIIYRDLEGPLYNFALRWVFDPARAEELVHDAFIRIWKRRDKVDVGTIKGLLFKTVQNLCRNERRRQSIRAAFARLNPLREEATAALEQTVIEGQDLGALRVALDELPRGCREVLLLSEFSQMSYTEIAKVLDIAEGTVASRKNRALAALRQALNGETP